MWSGKGKNRRGKGGNVESYQGGDFGDQARSSKVGCQMKLAFSVQHFCVTFYFTYFFIHAGTQQNTKSVHINPYLCNIFAPLFSPRYFPALYGHRVFLGQQNFDKFLVEQKSFDIDGRAHSSETHIRLMGSPLFSPSPPPIPHQHYSTSTLTLNCPCTLFHHPPPSSISVFSPLSLYLLSGLWSYIYLPLLHS